MIIRAISDLHGQLPQVDECDLLIIAGDICPDRVGPFTGRDTPGIQGSWIDKVLLPWAEKQPAKQILGTWGNHDWMEGIEWFGPGHDVFIGTGTMNWHDLRIWLSPYVPRLKRWAHFKEEADLDDYYRQIPEGIDILVTHAPPWGYGDVCPGRGGQMEHAGSEALRWHIDRIHPRAIICGHIHEGFGAYKHNDIPIYNVSVLNEHYQMKRGSTLIELR